MAVILTQNGMIKETIIKYEESITNEQVETLTYLFNIWVGSESANALDCKSNS